MFSGLADLSHSERGILTVIFALAITVMAFFGKVSFAEWREYTLYLMGLYMGSKTIQGAVDRFTRKPKPKE